MGSDPGFFVAVKTGRLVEARVTRLATREDADAYGLAVASAGARVGPGAVLLADHRVARIYPPAAADRLVELFRPNNTRYVRIAMVVNPANATLLLQFERLAREGGSDLRRVCRRAPDAIAHLADSLDPAGLARAQAFLDEIVEPVG